MIQITSSQNPAVKELKSLKSRKDREEKGLFYIEGLRIVEEAVQEKANITGIFISEGFADTHAGSPLMRSMETLECKQYLIPDKLFAELADTETPQGILAVIGIRESHLEECLSEENLLVMLESVRDPGNMGTIIRTADAAGFTGIIVSKDCVDVYNPKVLRSTMGSIFHVPIYRSGNFPETIREIKARGIKVYAAHLEGKCSMYDADLAVDSAVIIGNEANGISREVAALADRLVKIPMAGKAESLNASIAAGVLMYEALRQREHHAGEYWL